VNDVEAAIDAMTGRTIMGGVLTEEGLHLWLDDGRIVVILEGILAVVDSGERQLQ
jgi:hypothetical protein